jgi:hypothetical protein
VSENIAGLEVRAQDAVEVQVRATDRGRRDLDDGVARFLDARIRYVRDRDIVIALPRQSFNDDSPPNASTSAALSLPRPPEV